METTSGSTALVDQTPVSETPASGFQSINNPQHAPVGLQTPAPVSLREYWSDADKYDLLWSVILSTGATLPTLDWSKIRIPAGHTQQSAAVIVQDIAFGKHHITHPTFTPSNTNTSRSSFSSIRKPKTPAASSKAKKRKLQDENANPNEQAQLITPSHSLSHASSSSPSPHSDNDEPGGDEEKSKKPRRRKRSESPIELDLTNPSIRSFLQSEGYMAEDGTPVKRKRGRPTKDPFGLSVTLKKQLQRLDPNAPPMKKRGRPRKPFPADILHGGVDAAAIATDADGRVHLRATGDVEGREGDVSPSLRSAIEKIGEEMDREVEGMLNESRGLDQDDREHASEDEDGDESDGYEVSATENWGEIYEGDSEAMPKDSTAAVLSGADKENVPVEH
ncbi:hypothetical protein ABW21_db0205332 [Orbilia brochopaga]|nr:hypothetical protein ABW21_db0205332 [Drechslerella brochopaga]